MANEDLRHHDLRHEDLRHDVRVAASVVWLILAAVSGLVVAAPFLLPSTFLLNLFPACQAKTAGGSCILCGMTTAFVSIGEGDLVTAQLANRGAIAVYLALVTNFLATVAYTIVRVTRHANP